MNALPVGPDQITDTGSRNRYFDDLERWGFDIAYSTSYAVSYDEIVGRLKEVYTEFVAAAHKQGFPACIQIQSTLCTDKKIGIEEAQYDASDNPVKTDIGFLASYASDAWRDYLKNLTSVFVKNYGFDYVVFEEPICGIDIPGTKDRFYSKFMADNPGVEYPVKREETTQYLKVQQAKADVIVDFYRELTSYAKSIGAKDVGVIPWLFAPTVENTPEGTMNASCNIGRLVQIPDVDFLVSRMQPSNIFNDSMRTGDEMQKSPTLAYAEVLAYAAGKELLTVIDPTNGPAGSTTQLLPLDFYRDAVLSSVAGAPGGFVKHWFEQNKNSDKEYTDILVDVAKNTSRISLPCSPVAFVFSYSGTQHAEPLTYETVFQHYWAFIKQMLYKAHLPVLTFFADTLEEDLARHPETQVLVIDEHFPLSVDQMRVISRWWQSSTKRAVVAFGSGLGFSADVDLPGVQPNARAFPGIFELVGLRQEDDPQFVNDEPVSLRDTARIRRSAFLGDDVSLNTNKVTNVRRVFGSRASVLYDMEVDDTKIPVVVEWRDRSTLAVFCGFGLLQETAAAAEKAVRYALREVDSPAMMIDSCSDGILWNINRSNYLVMSNISDKEGSAVGRPGRANFWDCKEQKMLDYGDPQLKFEPNSFQVYRVVGRRSKFFDVLGASSLRGLIDGAGRAEIDILAGLKTVLVLRASPKEISVDGKPSTVSQEVINGAYHVTLLQCPPGVRKISLKW